MNIVGRVQKQFRAKVLCKQVITDETTKKTLTNKYFTHKDIVDTVDEIDKNKKALNEAKKSKATSFNFGNVIPILKNNIEKLEKKLETLHAPIVKQLAEIAKCRRAEKHEALLEFLRDEPPSQSDIGGIIQYTTLFKVENDPGMINILDTSPNMFTWSEMFSEAARMWLEQSKSKNSYKLPVDAYLLLRPRPGKRGAFEDKRFRDPSLLQMYSGENIQYLKF